jgi:hypothetical protein
VPHGPRTTKHKNITRIDHPTKATHGYNVRIAWKGKKHGKFFSDRVYGNQLAALHAAITWRDKTEKKIGKPCSENQIVGFHSRNSGSAPDTLPYRSSDCRMVLRACSNERPRPASQALSHSSVLAWVRAAATRSA